VQAIPLFSRAASLPDAPELRRISEPAGLRKLQAHVHPCAVLLYAGKLPMLYMADALQPDYLLAR